MKAQDQDRINKLRYHGKNSEIDKLAQFAETLYSDNKRTKRAKVRDGI